MRGHVTVLRQCSGQDRCMCVCVCVRARSRAFVHVCAELRSLCPPVCFFIYLTSAHGVKQSDKSDSTIHECLYRCHCVCLGPLSLRAAALLLRLWQGESDRLLHQPAILLCTYLYACKSVYIIHDRFSKVLSYWMHIFISPSNRRT